MRRFYFFLLIITLTLCQFKIPPGGPHLLLGWLVALAFYSDSPTSVIWAFWIGALHSFPTTTPDPWSLVFILLSFIFLRKQRHFLGCDHLMTQMICLFLLSSFLDLIDWLQIGQVRPPLEKVASILIVHALLTTLCGLLIVNFAKIFSQPLGLRQTKWDF